MGTSKKYIISIIAIVAILVSVGLGAMMFGGKNGEQGKSPIGDDTDRSGIEVGDYIWYEPDPASAYPKEKLALEYTGSEENTKDIEQESLKWQVLKIYDDGSMDLIGNTTRAEVSFANATGYNNGVYIMNDICKSLYSREGIEARSVNLNDFEDEKNGGEWKKARDSYQKASDNPRYGQTNFEKYGMEYDSWSTAYPNLYANENGSGIDTTITKKDGINDTDVAQLDKSTGKDSYKEVLDKLIVTQTYYQITVDDVNYGNAHKALKTIGSYWIASRYVDSSDWAASFGLRSCDDDIDDSMWVSGWKMVGSISPDKGNEESMGLRPVVTIGPNVKIDVSDEKDYQEEKTHHIYEY